MRESYTFEDYSFDSRVFRFVPDVEGRDLETLLDNKIWYSSVDNFNDPFEFFHRRLQATDANRLRLSPNATRVKGYLRSRL